MLITTALAASEEEYVKEASEVINKVRSTIPWVAKYQRDRALLGRASFHDMYSALNTVSGHYISFGPTAPILAKRKARILEEMDTAEKALLKER